jgi:hypothetical protein
MHCVISCISTCTACGRSEEARQALPGLKNDQEVYFVSYPIGFDGAVTAAMQELLRAVEGRLSGGGIHAQVQADGTASAASAVICKPGVDCSTTKNPHDPNVVIAAVIGLVVGLIIGYFVGKSSTKAARSTAQ